MDRIMRSPATSPVETSKTNSIQMPASDSDPQKTPTDTNKDQLITCIRLAAEVQKYRSCSGI
jgi:hypothetical protein